MEASYGEASVGVMLALSLVAAIIVFAVLAPVTIHLAQGEEERITEVVFAGAGGLSGYVCGVRYARVSTITR